MDMIRHFRVAVPAAAPLNWAVLVATVAARQAVSPTAAAQAKLDRPMPMSGRFAPSDGRFSADAAGALAEWKKA